MGRLLLCAVLTLLASCSPGAKVPEDPAAYTLETLVEGMPFHGIHGLTAGPDGKLYVGSVVGQAIYRVDPESGEIETVFAPPDGCADDMEFGPDGRLYWTQLFGRRVVASAVPGVDAGTAVDASVERGEDDAAGGGPGATIQVLADGRTGINSIAFKQDGRLFATEVFDGDALYEIDPTGEREARQILAGIGGLNGFDFGPDGKLYGPLWFKQVVTRVDVDSGELTTVATGFETPAAANFDSKGRLFVLDTARGEVVRVDVDPEAPAGSPSSTPSTSSSAGDAQTGPTTGGGRTVVATLDPGLDNLAFDARDRLFVTNMANNGIYQVDTETGSVRTVVEGRMAVPAGLALVEEADGREVLHVADTFAYRTVDVASGEVTTLGRVYQEGLINPIHLAVGETRTLVTFFLRGEGQLLERGTGHVVATLELPTPGAALALPGDRFLVADMSSGALIEVAGEEGAQRRTVAQGLGVPAGLAWAGRRGGKGDRAGDAEGDDRVYVSDAAGGRLLEVALASGETREIATGLAQPEGIAATPGGNVVVAEVGGRLLSRIDPATGGRTVIAENLAIGVPVPAGLPPTFIPTGVAVSKTGAIYLSSDVDSAIYRLAPDTP